MRRKIESCAQAGFRNVETGVDCAAEMKPGDRQWCGARCGHSQSSDAITPCPPTSPVAEGAANG